MEMHPDQQVATPCFSSWGYKGYCEYWLEESNDWIYRHLHKAADRMVQLANRFPSADGLTLRALNQAARELLLAQSSDWAFIIRTNTCVEYAVKRTKAHLINFTRLYDAIENNNVDPEMLTLLENKDSIFPEIDYRVYRSDWGRRKQISDF